MTFSKNLYLGKNAAECKKSIIKKLKHKIPQFDVYAITPSKACGGLLDIIPGNILASQNTDSLHIIGIAVSSEESLEVCRDIICDVYKENECEKLREKIKKL